MRGPPQPSAPLLAHWQGHATFEQIRPPLQPWFQQVQCPEPQAASVVQVWPISVKQRPWKHALWHEPGSCVPSARRPAHSPAGGAYPQGHERPQERVVHCASPQVQLSRHSAFEVHGSPSSDLQTPARHARLTPHPVPSATFALATQTGAALLHAMIAALHGWLAS